MFHIIQNIKDIVAFFRMRRVFKRESSIRDSKMNQYDIKSNTIGNVFYVQVNCDKGDYINASYNEEDMLFRKLRPISNYLSEELDLGDYLVPQVSNFVDEDNNLTFSYGVLFVFSPHYLNMTKLIVWGISFTAIVITAITKLCLFLIP